MSLIIGKVAPNIVTLNDKEACATLFSQQGFSEYMRRLHCLIYSNKGADNLDDLNPRELSNLRSFLENAKRAAALHAGEDENEWTPDHNL